MNVRLDIYPLLLRILGDRTAAHENGSDTSIVLCFEQFGVKARNPREVTLWGPSWLIACAIDESNDEIEITDFQGNPTDCYRHAVMLRLTF